MWLFLITGGLCAVGRLTAVIFPGAILPKPDVSMLLWISVAALVLRGMRRFGVRLWDGMAALIAFGLFPLAAGILPGSDCWPLALAGAAVYACAAEVMDAIGERVASGGRGNVTFAVNGLLLGLVGQAMNHIFF